MRFFSAFSSGRTVEEALANAQIRFEKMIEFDSLNAKKHSYKPGLPREYSTEGQKLEYAS